MGIYQSAIFDSSKMKVLSRAKQKGQTARDKAVRIRKTSLYHWWRRISRSRKNIQIQTIGMPAIVEPRGAPKIGKPISSANHQLPCPKRSIAASHFDNASIQHGIPNLERWSSNSKTELSGYNSKMRKIYWTHQEKVV